MEALTYEEAHRLFAYDQETGILTRKVATRRSPVGSEVGTVACNGYLVFGIYDNETQKSKNYLVHRVAFLMMTGRWPNETDHIDGERTNNAWYNLREVTRSQNNANRAVNVNNPTGLKGVSYNKKTGKYIAGICVNGKRMYLGSYDCPTEAHKAYCVVAKVVHGHHFYAG